MPVFPFGTTPSALTQVQTFVAEVGQVPPDALYVVYAGHDDVLLAADVDEPLGQVARAEIVLDAVGAIENAVAILAESGARSILVPNLADLGHTPRARFVENNPALASDLVARSNEAHGLTRRTNRD